ncbi:MAG: hypothetical protein AABY67_06220 [Nitrospirota bacterium]|jgi:hypothetical protein
MGMRRLAKEFRKNWRFIGAMILLALLAGVGTAFMSNGLNVLLDQASLAQKALNHPETLTEAEKTELKKAFVDKPSAEKYYDSLPPVERENARKALDANLPSQGR